MTDEPIDLAERRKAKEDPDPASLRWTCLCGNITFYLAGDMGTICAACEKHDPPAMWRLGEEVAPTADSEDMRTFITLNSNMPADLRFAQLGKSMISDPTVMVGCVIKANGHLDMAARNLDPWLGVEYERWWVSKAEDFLGMILGRDRALCAMQAKATKEVAGVIVVYRDGRVHSSIHTDTEGTPEQAQWWRRRLRDIRRQLKL